uniref:Uncharacterized protein n=1 Tax=Anguilla anguilla TaxID=7936 RepID=A0A0E9PUT9_ANGAN
METLDKNGKLQKETFSILHDITVSDLRNQLEKLPCNSLSMVHCQSFMLLGHGYYLTASVRGTQ